MFFSLSSWVLALLLFAVVVGTTCAGLWHGRTLRHRKDTLGTPLSAVSGALLGLVGLLLAFGLAMSVGRYETRRAVVVEDANAIGTAFLRAQTLPEPQRSASMTALRAYVDTSIRLSEAVPDSDEAVRARKDGEKLQRELWGLAGDALRAEPDGSAVRLYVEALNVMIDLQTTRVAALRNRVPGSVLVLEIVGAAVALGLLALYLGVLGRGARPVLFAAGIVTVVLLVTFDLDRPTRGVIQVPDGPLVTTKASMALPPAAGPP